MIQRIESISQEITSIQTKKNNQNNAIELKSSLKEQNLKIDCSKNSPEYLNTKTFEFNHIHKQKYFLAVIKLVQRKINQRLQLISISKMKQNSLQNRCNNSFSAIFSSSSINLEAQNPECELLGLQSRCKDKTQEKDNNSNPKNLQKKVFSLKLLNQNLKKQVTNLKQEIEENAKRQAKEVMKKKQSLEGLMEEIADKNQFIQELKATIRLLQAKLGAKQKGILQCLLEEDSQSLRKVIMRLQSVNDKLNFDLAKTKKERDFFQIQNTKIIRRCQQMQNQFKVLKQSIFDLEANYQIVDMMKKQVSLVEKKYKSKVERAKKLQKRLSQVIKSKDTILELQTEVDLQTLSRKVDSESTASNLKRASSLKSQLSQSKIQSIFNFIFNISDEKYQLQFQHLFDDQQKQLIKIHKQIFIKNQKNHIVPNQNMENLNCSYYFGKSFVDIFNNTTIKKEVQFRDQKIIINLEEQRQKLISKICSLKERQMHIRQVVINLFKAFQLKPIKKQSEIMFDLVCQLFEYSEGERQLFSHPKSRKLFGFI